MLMKGLAVVLDGLGLVLMLTLVGEIGTEAIGLVGDSVFFIWFWMKGAQFTGKNSGKKMSTLLVNSIIESIPFINGVYPGFSVEAWRLTALMREEDEQDASRKIVPDQRAEAIRLQVEQRQMQTRAVSAANDNAAALEEAA